MILRPGGPELARRTTAPHRLHEAADLSIPFTPLRDAEPVLALGLDTFIDALIDVPPNRNAMERVLAFNRGQQEVEAQA